MSSMDSKLTQQLQEALLAAFPTRAALAAMVQFGLGQNLLTIAKGANLAEVVAQLCTWAEDQAGLAALVAAARQANPTNARLATVAGQYDWAALDRQRRAPPRCPYPGMRPFTAADAPDFYGRAAEVQELLGRLRHERLLLVIGPSGSGKSSLVTAGLLPALARHGSWPPGTWRVRTLRPGAHPRDALVAALGGPPTSATLAAVLAAPPPATRLLLVIDQFEELFAQTDRATQTAWLAALEPLRADPRCTLLLTLRADFYPDLMTSDLWPVASRERLDIAPLDRTALREAIARPAEQVGVTLEPALIERLLADAADEPGSLPLLQETLVLLWARIEGRLIPLRAYEQLGGLASALTIRADAVFASLAPAEQAMARRIFLRLVQFGEGRPDTRRRQPVEALQAVGDDPAMFAQTLAILTENRLLTLGGWQEGGRYVDLAHEALISGWPTLGQWLGERREAELTRRRLEDKGQEWTRLGAAQGGLLDEVELGEAERWLDNADAQELGYSAGLTALVTQSRAALETEAQAQEAARQRELKQAQALAAQQERAEEDHSRQASSRAGQSAILLLQQARKAKDVTLLRQAVPLLEPSTYGQAVDILLEWLKESTPASGLRRFLPGGRSDPAAPVRQAIVEALGQLSDTRAIEPLQALLNDPNAGVQQAAQQALDAIIKANPPPDAARPSPAVESATPATEVPLPRPATEVPPAPAAEAPSAVPAAEAPPGAPTTREDVAQARTSTTPAAPPATIPLYVSVQAPPAVMVGEQGMLTLALTEAPPEYSSALLQVQVQDSGIQPGEAPAAVEAPAEVEAPAGAGPVSAYIFAPAFRLGLDGPAAHREAIINWFVGPQTHFGPVHFPLQSRAEYTGDQEIGVVITQGGALIGYLPLTIHVADPADPLIAANEALYPPMFEDEPVQDPFAAAWSIQQHRAAVDEALGAEAVSFFQAVAAGLGQALAGWGDLPAQAAAGRALYALVARTPGARRALQAADPATFGPLLDPPATEPDVILYVERRAGKGVDLLQD